MKKLLLVDGNSLINRAFYATSLKNGAVFGFVNMFMRAVENTGATHVAVAFDMRAKTFRHKLSADYKANRKGMPDELATQFADLKKLLAVMRVAMFEREGFEADDIIGTLSRVFGAVTGQKTGDNKEPLAVVILTGDRDAFQLIRDDVTVHLTKSAGTEIYDTGRIMTEYGVTPAQMIDVKCLMGDTSDNIKGVAGVGEKTALKVIKQCGSVDKSPYANDPSVALSKVLATIQCDIELGAELDDLAWGLPLSREVFDAFKLRGFNSFLNRSTWWTKKSGTDAGNSGDATDGTKGTPPPTQLSFF